MRYALILVTYFLIASPLAQAQDAKQQRINAAIDAAERVCLVGNRYKFEADASGALTISKLLPGGEAKVVVDHAEAKGSEFFDNEVIRREVDGDIRECMKAEWSSILKIIESDIPQPYKKIACTGEYEGRCPGSTMLSIRADTFPPTDK